MKSLQNPTLNKSKDSNRFQKLLKKTFWKMFQKAFGINFIKAFFWEKFTKAFIEKSFQKLFWNKLQKVFFFLNASKSYLRKYLQKLFEKITIFGKVSKSHFLKKAFWKNQFNKSFLEKSSQKLLLTKAAKSFFEKCF